MSLTRRHIVALAEALKCAKPNTADKTALYNHATCSEAVADVLESINPHFDRERFLRDCGVQS